jgi:CRISPR-associated protein Cas5d
MHYWIDTIRVLKKGRWVSFRRNEVMTRASLDQPRPILAGGGAPDGTQRNTLALADVEYVITAEVRLTELGLRSGQTIDKYRCQVERRARTGKCYHRPALGLREFAADFEWEPDPLAAMERRSRDADIARDWRSIWSDEDLGLILYDVFDPAERGEGFRWLTDCELVDATARLKGRKRDAVPRYEGTHVRPRAAFFQAAIRGSTLDCHPTRVRILKPPKGGESDAA